LVAQASELPTWKAPSKTPLLVAIVLGALVVLAIVFAVTRDSAPESAGPAVAASAGTPAKPAKSNKSKKTKRRGKAAKAAAHPSPVQTHPASSASEPITLQWDDHEALVSNKNNQVSVEGTAKSIDYSDSGKTIYLVFSSNEDRNAAQAGIELEKSSKEEMTKQLGRFIGKKIRVTGEVTVQTFQGLNRPDIEIKDLSAVEIIE
jgi:cytoskeletal protein RodZ